LYSEPTCLGHAAALEMQAARSTNDSKVPLASAIGFVACSFGALGLDWTKHVRVSGALRRPTDIKHSNGNLEKALRLVGWQATIHMSDVVKNLVAAEQERRDRSASAPQRGVSPSELYSKR